MPICCSTRWIACWPIRPDLMADPRQQLITLLEAHRPLECASVEPIKVRENAVYAVRLRDGTKAVLRIHRRGYHSDQALQSERIWMQALRQHGLDVPRHVLSSAGNSFEKLTIQGFEGERQVDVFQWIEGQQLGTVESGVAVAGRSIR